MGNLTVQSPLMQPVEYQGQDYFVSHYFHQQYLANSEQKGKYQRHRDFLRLIRSIENFQLHVEHGYIVELEWERIKSGPAQDLRRLKPLFQATGFYPLLLISATFQVELSHHLDDELSKQMSVAANTTLARQMTHKLGAILPEETALRKLDAYLQIGRLLKTPEHIVQQEAVKQIEVSTGLNLRPLLIAAPAQSQIAPDDKMYEPNDLAKTLGMSSGYAVNRALEQIGWQVKKIGGGWEPTPLGKLYAAEHAWTAEHGTKSGYNWKWNQVAVQRAFIAHDLPKVAQEAKD